MGQKSGAERRLGEREAKSKAIRLSFSTIILAFFLAFVAIVTAYLAGVMSGRHFSDAQTRNTHGAAESSPSIKVPEDGDGSVKKFTIDDHILTAEELEYARVLRRDENGPLRRLKGNSEKSVNAEKKDTLPSDTASVAEQAPRPSLLSTLEAEPGDDISDYLFQVGAFKDEKTVDSLREKLEGQGLRTMMERDGKLFLVMVRLRGTAKRAAELVALFVELGLGEPILRNRSPVKT